MSKPMKIKERVLMYRLAAGATQSKRLRVMYEETADVLEGLAFLYNDLYTTAKDTIQRCNGEDPALNILAAKMREHMTRRERSEWMPEGPKP